jgi:aspartyl-tRNA(Asn)/glutamyl-tRNA(Gln) amidotransferase subunit C
MPFDRDEVLHVARIYRIGLTDDEIERLQGELSDIMAQFDVLNEVDTSDVEAAGSSASLSSVMRDDTPRESFPREEVLGGAPLRRGEYFEVPIVLEAE